MSGQSKMIKSAIIATAIGTVALSPQMAAANTWRGTTSSTWSTNSNWSPSGTPVNSIIAEFDSDFATAPVWTNGSLTAFGGVWLKSAATGITPQSVTVTKGMTSGTPPVPADGAMQFGGATIDGNASTGILVNNTDSAQLTISVERIKIGSNQNWINNSSNALIINSRVDLDNKTLTVKGTGDTVLNNHVVVTHASNVGALVKEGGGKLTLAGTANDFRGNTTLTAGTLLVNGILANHATYLTTADGGTLGGTGTISRKTTINAAATLAPGAEDTVAEDLKFTRTLTLKGTTTFDLTGSGKDMIVMDAVAGQPDAERKLIFGGNLVVEDQGATFANGQTFDLFDWDGDTLTEGTFTSFDLPALPSGLSWEMHGSQPFNYLTGSINVVPEPFGLGTIGLAGMGVLLARRRSQARRE